MKLILSIIFITSTCFSSYSQCCNRNYDGSKSKKIFCLFYNKKIYEGTGVYLAIKPTNDERRDKKLKRLDEKFPFIIALASALEANDRKNKDESNNKLNIAKTVLEEYDRLKNFKEPSFHLGKTQEFEFLKNEGLSCAKRVLENVVKELNMQVVSSEEIASMQSYNKELRSALTGNEKTLSDLETKNDSLSKEIAKKDTAIVGLYDVIGSFIEPIGNEGRKSRGRSYRQLQVELELCVLKNDSLGLLQNCQNYYPLKKYTIFFNFNEYQIDSEDKSILNEAINQLLSCNTCKATVYGYSDEIGTLTAKMDYSEARAKSAFEYLINKGINPNKIKIEPMGDSIKDPKIPNNKKRKTVLVISDCNKVVRP